MKSIKKIMKEYVLSKEEYDRIVYKCLKHHLSEDELYEFILEFYMKKEMVINKRLQCYY